MSKNEEIQVFDRIVYYNDFKIWKSELGISPSKIAIHSKGITFPLFPGPIQITFSVRHPSIEVPTNEVQSIVNITLDGNQGEYTLDGNIYPRWKIVDLL